MHLRGASERESDPPASRARLERALDCLLRGLECAETAASVDAPTAERAHDGDRAAMREVALVAQLQRLPAKVTQAIALDQRSVALADGSTLSLEQAERTLARKEEARAHQSLRALLDEGLRSFSDIDDRGSVELTTLGRLELESFLVHSAPLATAALEALESCAGESLDRAHALARAFDMPDPAFEDAATVNALRALREAAAQPLQLFRAPRTMASVVFLHGTVARCASTKAPPRFQRHFCAIDAACAALARGDRHRAPAFALDVQGPGAGRSLGLERRDAERAARIAGVCRFLGVRWAVACALSPDEPRRALCHALFAADASPSLLLHLSPVRWTCPEEEVEQELRARIAAATLASTLRDRWDEGFSLSAAAWREDREMAEIAPSAESGRAHATAWNAWLHALL